MCVVLLLAGHETTVNLIGNGMLALLRHPDQLRRLRTDPSLTESAVEEMLRYDSPVQGQLRAVTQDLKLRDVTLRRNDVVIPMFGAANRDPEVFPNPSSTSPAPTTGTWRSARASTSASGRRSPGSRPTSRSRRCCAGSPPSNCARSVRAGAQAGSRVVWRNCRWRCEPVGSCLRYTGGAELRLLVRRIECGEAIGPGEDRRRHPMPPRRARTPDGRR